MFIVEGPTYVGKSETLTAVCKEVKRRRMGRTYGSRVYMDQRKYWSRYRAQDSFDYGVGYLIGTRCGELCNQFVLSELVYGPHEKFTSHRQRLVARELNRQGSVMVMLHCNWQTVKRRMVEGGDISILSGHGTDRWKESHRAYTKALESLAFGYSGGQYVGWLDTSMGVHHEIHNGITPWDAAFEFYIDMWRDRLRRSKQIISLAPQSWGFLWPKIIFVGEQVSGARGTRPFAGMNNVGASAHLSKLLDGARIPEGHCYYLNSYDRNGDRVDPRVFDALQAKKVVALGKTAAEVLTKLGIKHTEFPHPQWIRRSRWNKLAEYSAKLARVCRW